MKTLELHNNNRPRIKVFVLGLVVCFSYLLPLRAWGEAMETSKAMSVFSALDSIGNFYDKLTAASLFNLPAGVKRTLGNVEYSIAVSEVQHTTSDYTELTIYGRIQIPQGENKILFFGAQGIRFSYDGDFQNDCKLMLLNDVSIPITGNQATLILHGGFDETTGRGIELTCFTMDCSGFKELNVVADIVFSDNLIHRVDENDKPSGRVSCPFTTVVKDWNDIFVSISMPRFEINGLDGFIFDIKNAVFDFSDSRNEQNIVFPKDYVSNYLISGNINTWRGVYIRELSLVLPKQFAEQNSDRRISFAAQNMLIDNNGISGSFAGEDILSIDRGSAGGWRFSVNTFSLDIETNQLTGAKFSGAIGLPVSENSNLNYEAFISPGNEYHLKVSPANDFDFDIWKAKATINANSYVQLTVIDGKFRPEAMLNGSLSVSADPIAKIDDILFTGMHLQTVAPYFSIAGLGYEGEASLKGFPLSISQLELTTTNKEAKLGFDAKLSLAGDKTPVMAETRLEIVSSIEESGKWKYQKLDVSKIVLDDVTIAEAFSLNGSLTLLNDDPVYGDGFAGEIDLDIKKGIELGVKVRAIFGNKDYRYWLVDGLVEFPNGVTVFPPAVKLTGFGGGAYYRMKSSGTSSMPTGSGYVPDNNYGLGLKAAILFNIGKKGLADGESSFEIAFNKNGGINFISFYGQAKFLGEIPGADNYTDFVADKFKKEAKKETDFVGNNTDKLQELENMKGNDPNKAAQELFPATEKLGSTGLLASMGIQYDFTNKTLHSTFDMYINAVNGMLKGTGAGNKAGSAVFHVEQEKWYLHLGTPTNQMGVEFNLANLVSMETQSYFMAGHDIPDSPSPPTVVSDILGTDAAKLDYMRDLNALGDGRGLAFGSNLSIATDDITFLILYANFQAGLGFDIMLKDYDNAYCEGRSGQIGIDGWYANGQTYAYLQGELGVNVNLLFVKKKIPVIKGGAATLLQAKLPNPSWFSGYLGVKFDLLGGLIKGNMRLKISLGEECKIVMPESRLSDMLDMEVIGDITPNDRMSDVDVFSSPQAAFNMRIDKTFTFDDAESKSYRIKLDKFSVTQNGSLLDGEMKWNYDKNVVSFLPHEILPSQKELKIVVSIVFEEYKNGYWITVKEDNKILSESKEITFTTGVAPDVIPAQNIAYCYPVIGQKYFFTGETTKGYVQLKQGQAYLFSPEMNHEIHFIKENGITQKISLTYNSTAKRIEYTMSGIDKSSSYTSDIISFAEASESNQDTERRKTVELSTDDKENNSVSMRDAKAGDAIQGDAGKSRLSYKFATSAYSTLKEKVENITKTDPYVWRYGENADEKNMGSDWYLQYNISGGEPFDVVELVGVTSSSNKPLMDVYATLSDDYYKSKIKPLLYEAYPLNGITLTHRNPAVFGVPPARAVILLSKYLTAVEQGNLTDVVKQIFPFRYDLSRVYHQDFSNLREQVTNKYLHTEQYNNYDYLMNASFPQLDYGDYEIQLRYVFPDGTRGSIGKFTYFNALR